MIPEHKRIKAIVKKACKELGLKSISIKYNYKDDICFTLLQGKKHTIQRLEINYLRLYQMASIKESKRDYLFIKFNQLNSISKRIKFILFHELGHYLQCNNHRDYFIFHALKENKIINKISDKDYRELKLEKFADRIALHLINKGL